MTAPGLLIAAARSGGGKTTLALGLMRALSRRGVRVRAAKCGPDYIDPAFHEAATGFQSLNLDSWTMDAQLIGTLAARAARDADLVIAEGSMGLFDGVPSTPGRGGASADIASATGWPVVLVHDVSGQAQTAAAILRGLATHEARVNVVGVVLNKVGSERHRRLVADAIETAGIRVFGSLSRDASAVLPERHLGLVQASETTRLNEILEALADGIEAQVDIDALRACARASPGPAGRAPIGGPRPPGQRIAVARDDAFSFFYPHLALSWREAGAELKFFSPLADEPPPLDCDMCWLPGGYPELHAGRIAGAARFLTGLRLFAQRRPVHGECGGYMTLGRALVDGDGQAHVMAGLLSLETSFLRRKLHLGYRRAALMADHCLGLAGTCLSGHEFHYATTIKEEGSCFATMRDAYGGPEQKCGLREGPVSGSFFHVIA